MLFNDLYTRASINFINDIRPITKLKGQPEYINMVAVNGKSVAFLKPVKDYSAFHNNFMRIDRMVIPAYARLVNIKALLKQLPELRNFPIKKKNGWIEFPDDQYIDTEEEDTSAIDTTVTSFFHDGFPTKNIIVNTPGLVKACHEPNRHFHHCRNYSFRPRRSSITLTIGSKGLGSEKNCSSGHLSAYFEGNQLKYELNLFYIDKKDFEAIRQNEIGEMQDLGEETNPDEVGTIVDNLKAYFEKEDVNKAFPPVKLDWKEVKGVFLMPMFFPDERIVYLCLANVSDKTNGGLTIKENLRRWCEAVKSINEDPANREMYIGSGDLDFAGIDMCAILVGKHAFPVVIDSDIIIPEVVKNRVCISTKDQKQ